MDNLFIALSVPASPVSPLGPIGDLRVTRLFQEVYCRPGALITHSPAMPILRGYAMEERAPQEG